MKRLDLTGQRFGRLVAIKPSGKTKSGNIQWECRCDCGNTSRPQGSELKNGAVQSCGCLTRENALKASIKHGFRNTRLYRTWVNMKARCTDAGHQSYRLYGGRGIVICDEWQEFEPFMEWALASGYSDKLTIERMDVNGNYEPSNCEWIPRNEQASNRRNIIMITKDGETKPLMQWANDLNMSPFTIRNRMRFGWKEEDLLIAVQR